MRMNGCLHFFCPQGTGSQRVALLNHSETDFKVPPKPKEAFSGRRVAAALLCVFVLFRYSFVSAASTVMCN